jgi:hypothetical protein
MNIKDSLQLLNLYLKKKNIKRSFIICGGASLIIQGLVSRTTKDIDIVAPPIDKALSEAADSVASDLGLNSHWLNCGPDSLINNLAKGWKDRIIEVFRSSNLTVFSISREDLIFSKFWALCDRQKDKNDLILLNPSKEELNNAVIQTISCDGNPSWPEWVEKQAKLIKKDLGYE